MKITEVEAIILRQQPPDTIAHGSQDPLIIRIVTDDGVVGYGEADTFAWVAKAVVDSRLETEVAAGLRALLIGKDPLDPDTLWREMFEKTMYYGRRGVVIHALSGVEIALWDICGKAAGTSIAELLGGRKRDSVRTYATVGMPMDERALPDLVGELRGRGFELMKFGSARFGQDVETEVRAVAAARSAIGDGEFMIDIGRRWTDIDIAIETAARLEPYDLGWIEEPFLPDEYEMYRALAASTSTPIAAGEQDSGIWEFDRLLESGLRVIQPDVCRAGGFRACLRIEAATIRAGNGARCIPHEWGTGIAKAAALQLLAAMERDELFEYRIAGTPFITDLVPYAFPVTDGRVAVPSGPGLGIEVDEAILDHCRAFAS